MPEEVTRSCWRYHSKKHDFVPKRRFATRADAVDFNRDANMHPYCCHECSFWHLGHFYGAERGKATQI